MEIEKRKGNPRPNILLSGLRLIWTMISAVGSGILWAITQVLRGAWYAMLHLANGSWYAVKQLAQAIWWLMKQPYRLLHYIINGRVPEFDTNREKEIFWRVKRRFRRQRLFLLNSLLFGIVSFISLFFIGDSYLRWQRAITEGLQYPEMYQASFYRLLADAGIFMGIWLFVLIAHFVFNKMGNAEDEAIGSALDAEYERTHHPREQVSITEAPSIERLMDNSPEYLISDYDAEKPKRNGAQT